MVEGARELVESLLSSDTQLYLIVCNPMDCNPPGSSVHEIFWARILEWVVISSPRDLPNPGIEPGSPVLQADSLSTEPPEGLFYISTSPTHEGSTLMTAAPSKGSIS